MTGNMPIFYSAILLTGVNLLLRFAGTAFQVYISNAIGASGVGLLQLLMSVGGLALIAGMAGIRTGTMYLAAEELGRKKSENIPWVISGCMRYSILFSIVACSVLYLFSDWIAQVWIGSSLAADGLRLYAAFLPVSCLSGVMTGLYTAENRIKTLAAVEIAEQLFSMSITVLLLKFLAGNDAGKACQSIIFGSGCGSCLTLLILTMLHRHSYAAAGQQIPLRKRITQTALPLAAADNLKAIINTSENLMVPKRLGQCSFLSDPLAAFGLVVGMVFPVIMFPACILFGLAELLIPELARCNASGSKSRIRYLVRRSLKAAMIYGFFFSGILYLLAESIAVSLYNNPEISSHIKHYALLIPVLYCDAITDAMTKGLGQQKICVRYNILTSILDLALLYVLLPRYGMQGYFFSFTVCHLLNFLLSICRLYKITELPFPLLSPCVCTAAAVFSIRASGQLASAPSRFIAYTLLFFSLSYLTGIIRAEDISWIKQMLFSTKKAAAKRKTA